MEYKFLKKITIGDITFKIIYDYKSDAGASFCYPDDNKSAFIKFGMKNYKVNPASFLMMLIHEVKEILHIEQSTRFWRRGLDSYEFHYTHAEHSDLCSRLAGILLQFMK